MDTCSKSLRTFDMRSHMRTHIRRRTSKQTGPQTFARFAFHKCTNKFLQYCSNLLYQFYLVLSHSIPFYLKCILFYLYLPCAILFYIILSCSIFIYLALSYSISFYPILSHSIPFYPIQDVLSFFTSCYLVLPGSIPFYFVLSHSSLSRLSLQDLHFSNISATFCNLALSHFILFYPVPSGFI